MCSGFSNNFWPAPLLAQDRLLAPFFDQAVLCPNLCEPSLTPKNLGQWGCSSGQFVVHVLFFGPCMDLPANHPPPCPRPPVRDPPLCCVCRCCCVVVWCVGVCSRFSWVCPRFGPSPPPDSPSPGPRKISLFFFPLPPLFSFLSWGSFRGIFGGVIEGRDPQMCSFDDSPRSPHVHI